MKFFSWLPNFLTICNLLCGCLAIIAAMSGDFASVFMLIILAAIFDFTDGFAARMLKAYSPMGKELDSLADMVSFGVAPSFAIYALLGMNGLMDWYALVAFALAAFAALRLAKFNIDTRQSDSFIGIPTPAMALFFVSYAMIFDSLAFSTVIGNIITMALVVLFAGLMVCEMPMFSFKFKSFGFKENALRYFFALFAVLMVVVLGYGGVAVVILAYVLVSSLLAIRAIKKQ